MTAGYAHVDGNSRSCGAKTNVTGQTFVTINGKLWAVNGDENSHGGGALSTSNSWLTISSKGIIVQGDSGAADDLLHPSTNASESDNLISVG